MDALLPLIVNLVGGAAGGNIAGALLKNLSLGTRGNSVAGILGGGVASQFLPELLGAAGSMDIGGIVAQLASGSIGGAVTLIIVGLVKNMFAK